MSLRIRLFLALTLLPCLGLFLYFSRARQVFEHDKIAYVYDTSLAVTKIQAARVRSELDLMVGELRSLILTLEASQKTLSKAGEDLFAKHEAIQELALVFPDGSMSAHVSKLKASRVSKDLLQPSGESLQMSLVDPESQLIQIAIKVTDQPDSAWVIGVFSAPGIMETFQSTGGSVAILSNTQQDAILQPPHSPWNEIKKGFQPEQNQLDGTFQVDTKAANYLVSYAHIGVGGLIAYQVVDRGRALSAVYLLLRDSAAFILGLLAVMTLISIALSHSLSVGLEKLVHATEQVSQGDFKVQLENPNRDEIGKLSRSISHMAHEISRLLQETRDKARMEAELATARTVQETLFAAKQVQTAGVSLCGHYEPASECGGDWWYHFSRGESIYILIADVTGHGVPSALITSAARAVLSVAETQGDATMQSILTLLNRAIWDTSQGRLAMTFFILCIDQKTGRMDYINASHEAPILIRASTPPTRRGEWEMLNENNHPRLGERPEVIFHQSSVQLEPGDQVILYTDGLLDVRGPENKEWGERRFAKAILNTYHLSPEEVVDSLVSSLSNYRGTTALVDDVTVIVCRYNGDNKSA